LRGRRVFSLFAFFTKSKTNVSLISIFSFGLLLRLLQPNIIDFYPDILQVIGGEALAHGQGYPYLFSYPPFSNILFCPFSVAGQNVIYSARLLIGVFGAMVIFPTYYIGKILIRSETFALLAAVLIATDPYNLVFSRAMFIDTINLFLVLVLFMWIARGHHSSTSKSLRLRSAALGIVIFFLLIFRDANLLLVFVLPVLAVFRSHRSWILPAWVTGGGIYLVYLGYSTILVPSRIVPAATRNLSILNIHAKIIDSAISLFSYIANSNFRSDLLYTNFRSLAEVLLYWQPAVPFCVLVLFGVSKALSKTSSRPYTVFAILYVLTSILFFTSSFSYQSRYLLTARTILIILMIVGVYGLSTSITVVVENRRKTVFRTCLRSLIATLLIALVAYNAFAGLIIAMNEPNKMYHTVWEEVAKYAIKRNAVVISSEAHLIRWNSGYQLQIIDLLEFAAKYDVTEESARLILESISNLLVQNRTILYLPAYVETFDVNPAARYSTGFGSFTKYLVRNFRLLPIFNISPAGSWTTTLYEIRSVEILSEKLSIPVDAKKWVSHVWGIGTIGKPTLNEYANGTLKIVVGSGNESHWSVYTTIDASAQYWLPYDSICVNLAGSNTKKILKIAIFGPTERDYRFFEFIDNFSGWKWLIFPFDEFKTGAGSPNWAKVIRVAFESNEPNVDGTWRIDRVEVR